MTYNDKLRHIFGKLFCEWCGNTDTYDVTRYNQPVCNYCRRFIKK